MSETETKSPFLLVRDVRLCLSDGSGSIKVPLPPDYDEWFFVGIFRHDQPFEFANLGQLLGTLEDRTGRDSFRAGVALLGPDRMQTMLLVDPKNALAVEIARDGMDTHEIGGHLSDESYWREIDKRLQAWWTSMPMATRIDYAKCTDSPPTAALEVHLSEEEYPELWTHLYQEMGL